MFKAVLIIYTVSLGHNHDITGSLTTTPYESMAQCEEVKELTIEVVSGWKYSDGVPIKLKYSMECKELKTVISQKATSFRDLPTINDFSPHKRWDDK